MISVSLPRRSAAALVKSSYTCRSHACMVRRRQGLCGRRGHQGDEHEVFVRRCQEPEHAGALVRRVGHPEAHRRRRERLRARRRVRARDVVRRDPCLRGRQCHMHEPVGETEGRQARGRGGGHRMTTWMVLQMASGE